MEKNINQSSEFYEDQTDIHKKKYKVPENFRHNSDIFP